MESKSENLLSFEEKSQMLLGLKWLLLSVGGLCIMLGSGGAGEPTELAVNSGYVLLVLGVLVWFFEVQRYKQYEREQSATLRNIAMQLVDEYPSSKPLAAEYIQFFNRISAEIEMLEDSTKKTDLTFELLAFYSGFLLSKMEEEGVDIKADKDLGAKLMTMFQFIHLPNLSEDRTESLMEINREYQTDDAFREGFTAGTYIDNAEALTDYYYTNLGNDHGFSRYPILARKKSASQ